MAILYLILNQLTKFFIIMVSKQHLEYKLLILKSETRICIEKNSLCYQNSENILNNLYQRYTSMLSFKEVRKATY